MNWIVASLLSAFCLGIYDLFKKHAVRENAVLPVLFLSTLSGAAVWLVLLATQALAPGQLPAALVPQSLSPFQHAQLLLKSVIVAASWTGAYFALKHLPVSIAAPIRATGPVWTVLGAFTLLAERPARIEWLGIATTLGSFAGLSLAGRHDGIHFLRDKWVWSMVISTILGGFSALYDKYLLGHAGFTAATVQAWFSIYMALLFLPMAIGWQRRWWTRGKFHWRWSIPLIGLTLLLADYVYFNALRDSDALVSLVSSLRRGSVLVAFGGGLLFFGERHGLRKLPAVAGVLLGIILTALG